MKFPTPTRTVVTMALGGPPYTTYAVTLARSLRRRHTSEEVAFTLVTDRPDAVAAEGVDGLDVEVEAVGEGELGRGFTTKLHLDRFVGGGPTLFLDADCLVVSSLDPTFKLFAGRSFCTVGGSQTDGEWFGDLTARCRRYGVPAVPVFVGALYYMEPGEGLAALFARARALAAEYDEAGFVRLAGLWNEEPLLSVAMAESGLGVLPDDGTTKIDAMDAVGMIAVDALRGGCRVRGLVPRPWRSPPAGPLAPPVLHFNASFTECPPYTREASALRAVCRNGWAVAGARLAASVAALPHYAATGVKNPIRPVYRALFGTRAVRAGDRARVLQSQAGSDGPVPETPDTATK